jgi:uncharacterized protein (TIGR02001 family)
MPEMRIQKRLLIILAGFFMVSSNMVTAEDQNTITGNLTFTTDYVYRGISQTQGNMAIQGGLDYALPGGLYFSLWSSNVSGEIYSKGSMELDITAGYSTQIGKTFEVDLGLAYFMYPGAEITGPPSDDYDTTEFYIGGSFDNISFKYSRTLNDWYGVNSDNPFNLTGTAAGSSKGSSYIEGSATFELANDLSLLVRAGHCKIKNYGDANCTDYGLTVMKTIEDFDVSLAFSTTNANEILYTVDGEDTGDSRVVLSVARNF